jgi:predicted esterase
MWLPLTPTGILKNSIKLFKIWIFSLQSVQKEQGAIMHLVVASLLCAWRSVELKISFSAPQLPQNQCAIFAALVPICGGGVPEQAHILKNVPVWAFHGAKDDIVPLKETLNMVEALKQCGGKVELTVYADAGHDIGTTTYNNPLLYEWL